MTDDRAITVRETQEIQSFSLPDNKTLKDKLAAIQHFQSLVQSSLIEGVDYGKIPGVEKPSLYKSGAEKVAKLLELGEDYEILTEIEDWDKGFFYYKIKTSLRLIGTDIKVSSGLGSGNSKEPKYRYRWVWPGDVPANMDKNKIVTRRTKKGGLQYRLENEEPYEIVNTILKMAKKRSFIDATLSAGRLSNLFTQDIEDMTGIVDDDTEGEEGEPNEAESPQKTLGQCPECGNDLVSRSGQFGEFVACSGYPKCKYKPPKAKDLQKTPDPTNVTTEPEKNAVEASQGEIDTPQEEITEDKTLTKAEFETAWTELIKRLQWGKEKWYGHLSKRGLLTANGLVTINNRAKVIAELTQCAEALES